MRIICIGQGEIGAPLTKLLAKTDGFEVFAKDIEPLELDKSVDAMLISIPFKNRESFVNIVKGYVDQYRPTLVIVCSTVLPGTCKQIQAETSVSVTHSPIMGRHRKHAPNMMLEDIGHYSRFIGADSDLDYQNTAQIFSLVGFQCCRMSSTETSELSKLLETTYSGILIGWAQESERICNMYGVKREETLSLIREANDRIEFKRPTDVFPGFIGGHCIMPNIELLLQEIESDYLRAVQKSNELKAPK